MHVKRNVLGEGKMAFAGDMLHRSSGESALTLLEDQNKAQEEVH